MIFTCRADYKDYPREYRKFLIWEKESLKKYDPLEIGKEKLRKLLAKIAKEKRKEQENLKKYENGINETIPF